MLSPTRSSSLVSALLIAAIAGGCSRNPKAIEAKFLDRGQKQMANKDFARAILEFQNAANAVRADAEPYYQLGLAYLAAGRAQDGYAALVKATQLNPHHAAAQVKVAELLATSRDQNIIAEGEKRVRDVLRAAPENVDALDALAFAEIRLGRLDDAQEHLQDALKKLPQNLRSSVALARLDLAKNDPRGAEEVLKKAIALAPKSAEAVASLGQLYLVTERWADAQIQFQHALTIDPKHAPALLGLAAAQVRLGQKDQAEQTYLTVSSLPDKQYRHLHAVFLFLSGKQDLAIRELEQISKKDSTDRDARTRLIAAYLIAGRKAEAEAVLSSALKRNPKDTDALLQRVPILLASGKTNDAKNDLAQVINYQPDSALAHYFLARVYGLDRDAVRQRTDLNEALKYDAGFLPARLALAQNLVASGSAKSALDVLNAARPEQKATLPAIIQRNWALVVAGDQAGFRRGIDQGLAVARVPELLIQDSVAKLSTQDYPGARTLLAEVLKQTPDNIRALRLLADSYLAQKQGEKALQFLRQHAAEHPKSAPVQQLAGEWLAGAGQRAEARNAFMAAKAADPALTSVDLALARLDAAEGKIDSARSTVLRIVASDDGNIPARELLAKLEWKSGNYKASMEQYRKVLAWDPRNVSALNNLAYLLADIAGQNDEALKYAQKACELAPGNADVEGTLGWTYYHKGLYEMALKHLQMAVSKDDVAVSSSNAAIRKYHLAMTYSKLGDEKRGLALLEAAKKMNPDLAEAKMANVVFASHAAAN